MLRAEFGPQPAHVDVDRPGTSVVVITPHLLQELSTGEDSARMLREVLQQLEFLEGELERTASQLGRVGGLVHRQVAGPDDTGFRGTAGGRDPTDREPQPCLDLSGSGAVEDHVIDAPVG